MRSITRFLVLVFLTVLSACGTSDGTDAEARGSIIAPDQNNTALNSTVQSTDGGIFCTAMALQTTVASGQSFTIRVETTGFSGSYRIVNSGVNGQTQSTSYVSTAYTNTSGAAVAKKINVRVVDAVSDTYLCSTTVTIMPR